MKHRITTFLQDNGLHCYEEVYAIDSEGRSRFSDIIAFEPPPKKALICRPDNKILDVTKVNEISEEIFNIIDITSLVI